MPRTNNIKTGENETMSESKDVQCTLRKVLNFPLTRMVAGVVVCGFAMLAANRVLKWVPGSESDAARMIRWLLTTAVLLAVYYFLFKHYEKRDVTELSKTYVIKDGLWGLSISVLCVSLIIFALYSLGYYEVLARNKVSVLLLLLLFFLAAAAFEEVIFRGILYRIAEKSLGTLPALIFSAVLFALAHISGENTNAIGVVSAASGGILLGLMFSLTRRLWLPIAFHTGWNWALASFGTVVSGNEDLPVFLEIRLEGPEWITGGPFGPESSILTVGLVLLLSGIVYSLIRKKGYVIKPHGSSKKAVSR